jgi:DNA-binding transcriptional MerR regulator
MDEPRTLAVGAVARMAGVTVRTLHHYDEIGLLRPSGRSEAGYRRYTDAGLDDVRDALADPDTDALVHLRRQHALIGARIERLRRLSDAVALAMEAHQMNIPLTPEERLEVFGSFDPDEHAAEAKERWGDTDAYRESARRAARYTREDWTRIKAEGEAAIRQVVDAMAASLILQGYLEAQRSSST